MPEDKNVEREDRDLIRGMASRDAGALDAFYERYHRVAFGLILRIVGNRTDAEDVLTDVFWQVWQQSPRYDSSRGKPVAWLLTIARTRSIDCLRNNSRRNVKYEEGPARYQAAGAAGPDPFVQAGLRSAVQEALQTLSEQQRMPIEMAYYQGMSHREIAAALGQPLGTVKDRIRTGMMHLRKKLKAYLPI
jgi:RNA polymerase sigma-70 factor (ECF subfamily)